MTPRSTDAPNLTTYEASRLYLTGSGQDAPVRHHVVSRSHLGSGPFVTKHGAALLLLLLRSTSSMDTLTLDIFPSQLLIRFQT